MKEVVFYTVLGISSLFIFGYSIHMFVGGLVSPETETLLIILAVSIAAVVMGFMAWDVLRRR